MKSTLGIITFLISLNVYSQNDSNKLFIEDEIYKVKGSTATCYFLIGDSSIMNIRGCRNSEVCKYRFYLAKYNYVDSTLYLIGEGKNIGDSSRFDAFKIYVGKIIDDNYLAVTYKFEKLSYGFFDVIFKVKPGDYLFFNMGNYNDQLGGVLFHSMDRFEIGSLIYGKQ